MNTNHGLIIITIFSVIIRIDTRVDVVAVMCRDIKVGMNVRFPLFLYISLRVGNECEQVLHRHDLHSLGVRCCYRAVVYRYEDYQNRAIRDFKRLI